jgi:hypothetical protein
MEGRGGGEAQGVTPQKNVDLPRLLPGQRSGAPDCRRHDRASGSGRAVHRLSG